MNPVLKVDKHQLGRNASDFFGVKLRKRGNDDQVTDRCAPGALALDRNDAAAAMRAYGVGDETLAVVDVPDVSLLVFTDVAGVQQVFVNRARAS